MAENFAKFKEFAELDFVIGTVGTNRWIAAHTSSPYLCFEANSEAAVVAKLRRLSGFCTKISNDIHAALAAREANNIRHLEVKKTISAKELEYA